MCEQCRSGVSVEARTKLEGREFIVDVEDPYPRAERVGRPQSCGADDRAVTQQPDVGTCRLRFTRTETFADLYDVSALVGPQSPALAAAWHDCFKTFFVQAIDH